MVVKTKDPRALANKSRSIKRSKPKRKAGGNLSAAAAAATIQPPVDGDEKSTRAYLIAQEIKFAKLFAGNDTKLSEKQLKRLRRWLKIRSSSSFPFDRNNFMRIWKGLFYSMWMSDKPLPQEQLADNIASLVHAFDAPGVAVEFFGAFLQTMSAEWFGIDQWRIDKFMMLVRRCARQLLSVLHRHDWPLPLVAQLNGQLAGTVLRSSGSIGFFMHFTELWLEEVAKVTGGDIEPAVVTALLQPFGAYLGRPRDAKLCRHVVKHVFNFLLFQSELGREYQDRFEAWKSTGFAGNSIETMERFEDEDGEEVEEGEDEEDEEVDVDDDEVNGDEEDGEEEEDAEESIKHLDPRAGRVDVIMPEIRFDALQIVRSLEEEKTKPYTNVKSRQQITRVINNYEQFAAGQFPLGIQQIKLKSDVIELPRIEDKVNEMVLFQKKLHKQNDDLRNLNKRNRKKLLAGKPLPPAAIAKKERLQLKHQLQHQHDGNGCCGGHDDEAHGPPKKRRSITPAEKAKIKQWQEEDIPQVAAVAIESVVEQVKATPVKVAKAIKRATPAAVFPDPWAEPLQDGEVEFSTPSRKKKLAQIAAAAAESEGTTVATPVASAPSSAIKKVINPAAMALLARTPVQIARANLADASTPARSAERKSVKIMLQMNRSQEKSEYFQQLRNSPNTPFDANKKPPKGALKPNLMPSPINPYYKKKIGFGLE